MIRNVLVDTLLRMRDQIDASVAFIALCTPRWLVEPLCWAQLGYAVATDKPILLLVKKGTPIPENLRKVARRIVEFASEEDIEIAGRRLLADLANL